MNWLRENFKNADLKTAIICKGKAFSYKELESQIAKFSIDLKEKIHKNAVVAITSDYNFYSIALFLALIQNRNIIIPLLSSFSSDDIKNRLLIGNAEYKLAIDATKNLAFEKIKIDNLHPDFNIIKNKNVAGFVIFSSGSTGKPKAMLHDLSAIIDNFKNTKQYNNNMLVFLLSDHIGGLNTLFTALSSTSTLTLIDSRKPEYICKLIQKYKVNILPTTPTFLNLLLISKISKDYDFSSLKIITYGTESMSESLLIRLKKEFPNVKFVQLFGTSETGIISTHNSSFDSSLIKIKGANISYKILNGILYLKSNTQVSGYLNQDSNKFEENGWFNTGDLVEETKDGYIKILSRKDDIINVGGEKVFPSEIENYLMKFPFVLDCIVYGKSNAITGQSVVADVVLQDGFQEITAKKEIRKFFFQNTPSFKTPTKIKFIRSIDFNQRFKKIRKKE